VNYSMAPPRDAVDQTVARPPVADGDPYSTPVPRHFASNSHGFFHVFSPSQWHMLVFCIPHSWTTFCWSPLDPILLPPYGTPTDQAGGSSLLLQGMVVERKSPA
jgi:hypothetical protein